ncbi:MAG: hypothetical protein ACSW8F_04105, partial [bacterium]
ALEMGEGSVCENFRVTAGGALKKRGGTKPVVGLTAALRAVETGNELTAVQYGVPTAPFDLYGSATPDESGGLVLGGTHASVLFDALGEYLGSFAQVSGAVGKLIGAEVTARAEVSRKLRTWEVWRETSTNRFYTIAYASLYWDGARYVGEGAEVVLVGVDLGGKYVIPTNGGGVVTLFAAAPPALEDFAARIAGATSGRVGYVAEGDVVVDFENTDLTQYVQLYLTLFTEARFTARFHEMATEPNTGTGAEVQSLWSGWVGGEEVLCAVCNGILWRIYEEGGAWRRAEIGTVGAGEVGLFGFEGCLYVLSGDGTAEHPNRYQRWDGAVLREVEPYVPLIVTASPPGGGGRTAEEPNLLTGLRRVWFSPAEMGVYTFSLPEGEIAEVVAARDLTDGRELPLGAVDTAAGTVALTVFHPGENAVEVVYRKEEPARVLQMRRAELYIGADTARVFLYGDGSHTAFYSGSDLEGRPTAAYFPRSHVVNVGDENTPLQAMLRHHAKLLCFKADSTWSLDLTTGAREYRVTPVNRDVGCCARGAAVLCENRPRTLDGRSVIEWRATSSAGNVSADQRNAVRISQRVDRSLRGIDLAGARIFYDKVRREFYLLDGAGTAIIQNVEADAWYVYRGVAATCLANFRDAVFLGTRDGELRVLRDDYYYDGENAPIVARWESGAMDFGRDFRRKCSAALWIGVKPEAGTSLTVTAVTDRRAAFARYAVRPRQEAMPETERVRLRARRFTHYKLILENAEPAPVTVVSGDVCVRGTRNEG